MHGCVGEEPDSLDAEVGEDLAAQTDGAENAATASLRSLAAAELLMEEEAAGWCDRNTIGECRSSGRKRRGNGGGLIDVEAARGVVKVEDGAAALFGDHAHGVVEDFAAVAVGGEDVAGGAAGVDAHQNRVGAWRAGGTGISRNVGGAFVTGGATGTKVATNQGDMTFAAVDLAFVGDHTEFAIFSLNARFSGADDVALVAQAVADELGDGEDAETVLGTERDEVGDASHLTVVAHDFADDAGGLKAGEAGEIDGGFRLSCADQDASLSGAQREDVAGTDEIVGGGSRRDGGADGVSSVGGGDAGGDAFAGLYGFGECSSEAGGVLLGHGEEAQVVGALLGKGETDESAAVASHEIDGFGCNVLGGQREVALVFAVLIVDNDNHASGADFGDGAGNVSEWRLEGARAFRHGRQIHSR